MTAVFKKGITMTDEIRYACVSHIGNKRTNNEDNFWCAGKCLPETNSGTDGILTGTLPLKDHPAFAVMDGMGGESCGEQAAYLAASEFGRVYGEKKELLSRNHEELFQELCLSMNRKVVDYAVENHVRIMGSTVVFLAFDGKNGYGGNLGDSRLYQLRGEELSCLSTDHVYLKEGSRKGPLTQYLGIMEPDTELDPCPRSWALVNRDLFLICSDGVTDMLKEEEIREILLSSPEPEQAVEKILSGALAAGGRDNITAIVCRLVRHGFFSFFRP